MFTPKQRYCSVSGVGAGAGSIANYLQDPSVDGNSAPQSGTQTSQGVQSTSTSQAISTTQAMQGTLGSVNTLALMQQDKPQLPPATCKADILNASCAVASFGAGIVALIYSSLHDLIKDQRQSSLEKGLQQAQYTKDQASEMRTQADFQLAAELVEASFKMVSSAVQIGGSMYNMGHYDKEQLQTANTKISGISEGISTVGSFIGAILKREAAEHEAKSKELDADSQKAGAYRDQLQSITENLQKQASQILDTYQQMAQSDREATRNILA